MCNYRRSDKEVGYKAEVNGSPSSHDTETPKMVFFLK